MTASIISLWMVSSAPNRPQMLRRTGDEQILNLAGFRSVLVVQNFGVDHGAAGNGVLIVHQNAGLCEFGFIAHEMGHGFGLPHSYSANPDMEYGDGWDLMSFATTTFQFPIQFRATNGVATVGLNARNLEALNAIPVRRTWTPPAPDFSASIVLDPLNQPLIGNNGPLIATIPANATRPSRPNDRECPDIGGRNVIGLFLQPRLS